MDNIQYWLLDFDDTLVKASVTWAIEYAFPQLVQNHQLDFDRQRFFEALNEALEKASVDPNAALLLDGLLEKMGWDKAYGNDLMEYMRSYKPALFDDVIPFLERLKHYQKNAIIISNNPRISQIAVSLGVDTYVDHIFTPDNFTADYRKPDPRVWFYLKTQIPDMNEGNAVVVGDDPWSEGLFAKNCGIPCWLIDRHTQYVDMYVNSYNWVNSLEEIPLP